MKITEDLIERYVGFPDSLKEDVRSLVEATLATDASARQIAEFYREYYKELRGGRVQDSDRTPKPAGSEPVPKRKGPVSPSPNE